MENKKKQVAIYCRVSTKSDIQDGSYEEQIAYYMALVEKNPQMELAGIYGDRKSGRYMENRKGFQRMMAACEAGKIDLVLTKSISRFARNMRDCVAAIRKLKELGVVVRFEKEFFETDDQYSELMLSILAAIAQEESMSIGQNKKLADTQRNQLGKPTYHASYGYRRDFAYGGWRIVESEAKRVRLAFHLACQGKTYTEIRKELQMLEDAERTGKVWKQGPVKYMLTNVSYMGDVLTNKCFLLETENGSKCKKNRGNVDQYYIEDHHEPLVHRAVFQIVQELIKRHLLFTGRTKFSKEDCEILREARRLDAGEK